MINIIYRVCENETDGNFKDCRPIWFNKLNCLKSFIISVIHAGNNVDKIIFLHDGPKGILFDFITNCNIKSEIIKIDYRDQTKSLFKSVEIANHLCSTTENDIYFIEDDYLHQIDSVLKLSKAVKTFGLVTGYDHLYRYIPVNPPDVDYNLKIVFDTETNLHWRTTESTTHSWLTRSDIYKKISNEILNFGLWDIGLFIELHRQGIPLWSPMPGLTTQVDNLMSPGIDWEKLNKIYEI